MRQRNRLIPFKSFPSLLQAKGFFPGPYDMSTVDATAPFPKLTQRFIDTDTTRKGVASDCFNNRSEYTLVGFFPDFGAADRERVNPYVVHDDGVDGKIAFTPSAYIVRKAVPFFPEFFAPVDWRYWIKRSMHREWLQDGWRKPKMSLYSDYSIVNSLFELKQTLTLAKSWSKRDELIRRWHKFRGRNARLGDALQGAANERLAHVYGTKLLIQEARFLFESLTRINEKVDKFMKQVNTVRRLYKKTPKVVTFPLFSRRVPFAELGMDGHSQLVYEVNVKHTSRAVLYYWASMPKFKQYWTRVQQLCDAYGIRLDAGILWDAIPYSFTVDWFLNVGPWLHENWAVDAFQVDIRYLGLCHSARVEIVESLSWYRPLTPGTIGGIIPPETVPLATRETTVYRRSLGETPPIGKMELGPNNKPWSINRVVNACALIAQKAHVPARRLSRGFFGYTDD